MVAHSRNKDRDLLPDGIPENVLTDVLAQLLEKVPGRVRRATAQDDHFGRVRVDSTYKKPSQVLRPTIQPIHAEPVSLLHPLEHGGKINRMRVRKVPVAQHRNNSALQSIADFSCKGCCRTKRLGCAPRSGQTELPPR